MVIRIEPEAQEYIIKKQSGAVTVIVSERPGSCCVSAAVYLFVKPEKVRQDQMHSYHKQSVDGIEVYYSERVPRFFEDITLKVEKLLFLKSLVAVETGKEKELHG